jgi:hypothetical protein
VETPLQLATRLVAALDELIAQEGTCLRSGCYELAIETRQRAAPIVQRLVSLADQPGMKNFRTQLAGVFAQSAKHGDFLQEKMTDLTAEISRLDRARRRTDQVLPAYAGIPETTPRFQAAG